MTLLQLFLASLMLLAGVGIPIMAAMNADLGVRAQNPQFAVLILCICATILAGLSVPLGGKTSIESVVNAPPIYFLAGAIFIGYISFITFSAPIIGIGVAVFLVLLGQLISASLIDHYGWFGASVTKFSIKRFAGLTLMGVGILLTLNKSL